MKVPMRRLLITALFLTATALSAQPRLPANVEMVETYRGLTQYRLKSNDMTILLAPDHATPVFTFMVVYHVGSRNEAPGHTGSAHLLEHMIFNKSTENFGRARGHKTFQEVLYEAGADFSSTNMTTWYARMNGYSTLPADKLELAMKIEADRLGRALILDEERQPEMSVVRNEFEIGENNPSQALFKAVIGSAIQAHPYHWSTIGYRSDIEGVTTEKLREHYRNFFWANNSDALLVGDFEPQRALELFDREFGGFGKSPNPIPQVITVEPPQEGERRTIVRRPGQVGLVMIGYIRPGAMHPDFIPLEVLSAILGRGVSSRLHKAVVEKQLASDVFTANFTLRDPFPLLVGATALAGKTHEEVEAAIKAALREVAENGVTEEEVRRAQRQIEVSSIRERDGTYPFASSLGEAVASANWKWFLDYVDNINAVTPADVGRVAATYLVAEHATVGWFVPGASAVASPAAASNDGAPQKQAAARNGGASQKRGSRATGSFASRTVRRVLPNGLTVNVVENHAVPTVAIRGLVFAGESSVPSSTVALPELTTRMMQRGTKSRTKEQVGALLENAGATRSYGTNTFEMNLAVNGLSRDLPLLLDVLSDEIRNPAFSPEELAKSKPEMRTGVMRSDDNTSARAIEKLTQLVYSKDHPYRVAGKDAKLASLEAATAGDLREFHRRHYTGSNMILAIVGSVDAAKTIALVEKRFGALPKGQRMRLEADRVSATTEAAREVVTMPGKANMNLIFGGPSGLRRNDPDYEAALVGNAALGQNALSSRIGRRVRDTEGLSYNLSSRYQMSDALDGVWLVNVNVAPQNLARAMKSTEDEIVKFAREGVTDEEVAIQKNFFAGNFQVNLGSNAGVASALVTAEKFGFGPKYLDEYPSRIRAVTRAQVNAAMKRHLVADKLHVVVAGELEALPE
ncbi:MAG TPA: pitrilysin family protein [Thermoanaerobaculia bacterium]|nr:pitrilysin family protein [Thermoanaerobaculia bacterium]